MTTKGFDMKNWRTTVFGIAAAVAAVATAVAAMTDTDPKTVADWNGVIQIVGQVVFGLAVGLGLRAAQDAGKDRPRI